MELERARAHAVGRRGGASVLEAVVALTLGALLLGLVLSVLARQREVVASLAARGEALATARVVRAVLRREARAAGVGRWWVATDSISMRAFRGSGTVCPTREPAPVLLVRSWGVRAPDPTKDSVLLITERGDVVTRALAETGTTPGHSCPGDGSGGWVGWTLSEAAPAGVILARYYERGSYHLSGEAFRYRRGAAGRQPLTPEALRTPESRFVLRGDGVLALLFAPVPAATVAGEIMVRGGVW
jgi:hypothetical protein